MTITSLIDYYYCYRFFSEKLTNGTAGSPASPNPGPEEPSIYYDATENRPAANSSSANKASSTGVSTPVTSVVQLRESKDNKERDSSSRPHSSLSKIPVPVKSPRCSLSESTPETTTQNTKTGTVSEIEKSPAQIVQQIKDRDIG